MILKNIINKSYYGTVGYIKCEKDIELLEQYINFNLPILSQFKGIISATTFGGDDPLKLYNEIDKLWKKYFPESKNINNGISRGHCFGAADNDNSIIDYCKSNKIDWVCKSAYDIVLFEDCLKIPVENSDFYYLEGFSKYNIINNGSDFEILYSNHFSPQTNFYFIDSSKIDYLNSKNYIDESYFYSLKIPNYNGKIWEYIEGWSNENLLKYCVIRNGLKKTHLIDKEQYKKLYELVSLYNIGDPSHKNILINGICHYHYNKENILSYEVQS
jgi:hypothetical protein